VKGEAEQARSRARQPIATFCSEDRKRALSLTPVSRETADRLDRFVAILLQWQRTTNLIAPASIPKLWMRHIADSLQLLELAPDARSWIDFGSGGGFPGLPLACALADKPGCAVHLVESNAKKAAFLREAQRVCDVPAIIHAERMEDFAPRFRGNADIVTARAIAPLKTLLTLSFPLLGKTATAGLFPKGQNAQLEINEASQFWQMRATLVPSRTDSSGRVVVVRDLQPRVSRP
jgi:16S rRNA (guanine527-N7)-methyltransferase